MTKDLNDDGLPTEGGGQRTLGDSSEGLHIHSNCLIDSVERAAATALAASRQPL